MVQGQQIAERNGKKWTEVRDAGREESTGLGTAEASQKELSRRLMALSWVTTQRLTPSTGRKHTKSGLQEKGRLFVCFFFLILFF